MVIKHRDLKAALIGTAAGLGALGAAAGLLRLSRPARAHLASSIVWSVDDSFRLVRQLLADGVSGRQLDEAVAASSWGYKRLLPLALRLDPFVLDDFPAHLEWIHDEDEALVFRLSSSEPGSESELTLIGRV